MRTCILCKESKNETDFNKNKNGKDGLGTVCRSCNSLKMRQHHLKTKYNLSPDQYEEMSKAQNHLCAICGRTRQKTKRFAVDHCHKTGALRGLLCASCNSGIGKLGDSIEMLEKAIHYLKSFTSK